MNFSTEPAGGPDNSHRRTNPVDIPAQAKPEEAPFDDMKLPCAEHESRQTDVELASRKTAPLYACTKHDLDEAVRTVSGASARWAVMPTLERIRYLDDALDRLKLEAGAWMAAVLQAKGIDPASPRAGEEWLAGPVCVARNLRLLKETLTAIAEKGSPALPSKPYEVHDGKLAVKAFPVSLIDALLFPGFSGEVWMQKGVTRENLKLNMASEYRESPSEPKTALVLGAGNVASIGPMDLLHKLFHEKQTVVLKMNPVNQYLGPVLEKIFHKLIQDGSLRIVYGGASEGQYLCHHPSIDEIHITGSDKTHDAIMFGVGEEALERKKNRQPLLDKRITSELGNVSPVIVVPGPWSQSDLKFQGENIASMLTNNAGFNCNATRVIITHDSWKQREALVDAVRDTFARTPARSAYYPGAGERFEAFVKAHPEAEQYGDPEKGELPWTLIPNLDSEKSDEICFGTEAFCSVTGEVGLAAKDTVEYIKKAVAFANDKVWGSLNASIIVHPSSLKDPAVAEAVEWAVANLKAGSVGVNHWAALSYAFVSTTWGAYPGHDIYDVRSGIGVVHNTFMFDKPEKTVVRGPFRMFPKPAWFCSNERAHEVGKRLFEMECDPSLTRLPGLAWQALRG